MHKNIEYETNEKNALRLQELANRGGIDCRIIKQDDKCILQLKDLSDNEIAYMDAESRALELNDDIIDGLHVAQKAVMITVDAGLKDIVTPVCHTGIAGFFNAYRRVKSGIEDIQKQIEDAKGEKAHE